jgi:glucokinase
MRIEKNGAVGVEIGGGKTTVALVDSTGHIQQRRVAKTLRGRPVAATLEPYLRAIDEILVYAQQQEWHIQGIGVSVPGAVDDALRRPTQIPLLPSLNQFPLCDLLESRYQLPASVYADVDALLLGERQLGIAHQYQRLLLLTVNTVVGASLCVDGRLKHEEGSAIGHICHMPINNSGTRCCCGRCGCINTLLSWDALQRMVQRALRRGKETSLLQRFRNHETLSYQLLAEEVARGDGLALQIYGEVVRCLKVALEKYVTLFEPNAFILAGGVVHGSDYLLTQLRPFLDILRPSWYPRVEIIPARLGRDGALIGATVPAFELVKSGKC